MMSFLQNFATWFGLIEIVLAVTLIVLVLLQAKGSDMSALLGGGDTSSNFRTKRGLEAVIHRWTIYLSIIFFIVTILTFISIGQAS